MTWHHSTIPIQSRASSHLSMRTRGVQHDPWRRTAPSWRRILNRQALCEGACRSGQLVYKTGPHPCGPQLTGCHGW
ncbi:hypothetical protein BHE74_00041613 [Ensete ventricosum]|nr:hypothetical protein BHE74_00041613 [Ensete ventricosum]